MAVVVALSVSTTAKACGSDGNGGNTFFISGILKKNVPAIQIKLVQSIEKAEGRESAFLSFSGKVVKEYPEYKLLDVVINQYQKDANACEGTIKGNALIEI